jgi:hypothetical protein
MPECRLINSKIGHLAYHVDHQIGPGDLLAMRSGLNRSLFRSPDRSFDNFQIIGVFLTPFDAVFSCPLRMDIEKEVRESLYHLQSQLLAFNGDYLFALIAISSDRQTFLIDLSISPPIHFSAAVLHTIARRHLAPVVSR